MPPADLGNIWQLITGIIPDRFGKFAAQLFTNSGAKPARPFFFCLRCDNGATMESRLHRSSAVFERELMLGGEVGLALPHDMRRVWVAAVSGALCRYRLVTHRGRSNLYRSQRRRPLPSPAPLRWILLSPGSDRERPPRRRSCQHRCRATSRLGGCSCRPISSSRR